MLKLNPDWEDISDLINSVIQKIQTNFPARKIEFEPKGKLPLCKIDSGIIEQVVYNILQNAVQYTPEKSQIFIESEITNKQLRIIILDQGKGIPEEFLKIIFDKFYRMPNSKAGGIGLGLSIVKGFLEAHNGSIVAENCSPQGLKFIINIPVEVSYINNLKNE
jgi:two-component system sensor histidine kinase KdpD